MDDVRDRKLTFFESQIGYWSNQMMELGTKHDLVGAQLKRAVIMRDSFQQQWEDVLNEDTDHD